MVKNPPAMRKTWVRSLGWKDPLEKGMATHSSTLAWGIPWTKEPGWLQSLGWKRVRHDWATFTFKEKRKDDGKTSLKLYGRSPPTPRRKFIQISFSTLSLRNSLSYSFHKYLEKYIEKSRLFVGQLERLYFIWTVRFYFSWHPQDLLRPVSRCHMSICMFKQANVVFRLRCPHKVKFSWFRLTKYETKSALKTHQGDPPLWQKNHYQQAE